jgi:hypothetical protein
VANLLRDICQGNALASARYSRFDFRRYRIIVVLVLVLISLNLVGGPSGSAQTPAKKNVLILNEVGASYPGIKIINEGIQAALNDSPYH